MQEKRVFCHFSFCSHTFLDIHQIISSSPKPKLYSGSVHLRLQDLLLGSTTRSFKSVWFESSWKSYAYIHSAIFNEYYFWHSIHHPLLLQARLLLLNIQPMGISRIISSRGLLNTGWCHQPTVCRLIQETIKTAKSKKNYPTGWVHLWAGAGSNGAKYQVKSHKYVWSLWHKKKSITKGWMRFYVFPCPLPGPFKESIWSTIFSWI